MKNRRNYYRVLQVQPDAPEEVIKASFRTLMQKLKHHPDLGGDEWNASVINQAYSVLSNPQKRAAYDQERAELVNNIGQDARSDSTRQDTPTSSPEKPVPQPAQGAAVQTAPVHATNTPPCLFCGTPTPGSLYSGASDLCTLCHAPTTLPDSNENARSRQATRISKGGTVKVWVVHGAPAYDATIQDLSPTGVRFVIDRAMPQGSVIKLSNEMLSAIGQTTHHGVLADGRHSVGVKFLRLSMNAPRGTFVTARA